MNEKTLSELYAAVTNFIEYNEITCEDAIYQSEDVSLEALNFIKELYRIVKG